MGRARWDAADWTHYTASAAGKGRAAIFASRAVPDEFDPRNFKIRESRDSAANPSSTAIIIGADVTGSMGFIAEALVRKGIGTAFEEILRRAADPAGRMVPDPHMLVMGIGDVECDRGPVQATQFEADITIARQLERVWLEGGGGGNSYESYSLAWYFGAMRTSIDCWEKRRQKGFLFTIGDEPPPPGLKRAEIERFLGDAIQQDLTSRQLLDMVEQMFHVFHIVVEEGSFARRNLAAVMEPWRDLLGQRVLSLADHTKLAEVIVSAIEVTEGRTVADTAASWSGGTAMVVAKALKGLVPSTRPASGGVVRFS